MLKLVLTDFDETFLNSRGDFDHKLFSSVKSKLDNKNSFCNCYRKASRKSGRII